MNNDKNEVEYIRAVCKLLETNPVVTIVGDAYDIFNFCDILGEMKEELQKYFDKGKMLVVRPDSGDPVSTPIRVVEKLAAKYGYTMNSKGYKVLNNVRVIQGDGINIDTIRSICIGLKYKGFSIDNIAFGMGGALLQIVNRDDQKFAIKCSAIEVDGKWRDVFKDPITDPGKKSKAGRVDTLIGKDGKLVAGLRGWQDKGIELPSAMQLVYKNGSLYNMDNLKTIRSRADI